MCKLKKKKSCKADTTLSDATPNCFSDSTLADTTLANITQADTLHLQIQY